MTSNLAETDIGFKTSNTLNFTVGGSATTRIITFTGVAFGMYELVLTANVGTEYCIANVLYKSTSPVVVSSILGGVTIAAGTSSNISFGGLNSSATYYLTVRYTGYTS